MRSKNLQSQRAQLEATSCLLPANGSLKSKQILTSEVPPEILVCGCAVLHNLGLDDPLDELLLLYALPPQMHLEMEGARGRLAVGSPHCYPCRAV